MKFILCFQLLVVVVTFVDVTKQKSERVIVKVNPISTPPASKKVRSRSRDDSAGIEIATNTILSDVGSDLKDLGEDAHTYTLQGTDKDSVLLHNPYHSRTRQSTRKQGNCISIKFNRNYTIGY